MTHFSEDRSKCSAEDATNNPELHKQMNRMAESSAQTILPVALSAAVPLWIHEIYERGGPTGGDWTRLPAVGRLLAERGDCLLYPSPRAGETANLFNALAEALALLAFQPGGVSFGEQHFDALQILTAFLGVESAQNYLAQVRQSEEQ